MGIIYNIEHIIHHPHELQAFREKAIISLETTHHLPETKIWEYLEKRRSLAPHRFDHYHPEFKDLFNWPIEIPIPIETPVPRKTPFPKGIPEPSSYMLLALGMIISIVLRKFQH